MLLQGPILKKEKVEESPKVEYKTVPCKKYWTVGHCELGPRCVYIHQVREIYHVLIPANTMSRRLVMPWRSRSLQTTASFHLMRLSLSRLRSQILELTVTFKGVEYKGCFFKLAPPENVSRLAPTKNALTAPP